MIRRKEMKNQNLEEENFQIKSKNHSEINSQNSNNSASRIKVDQNIYFLYKFEPKELICFRRDQLATLIQMKPSEQKKGTNRNGKKTTDKEIYEESDSAHSIKNMENVQ